MAFCRNCGNQISEGTAFCGRCGAKLDQQTAPASCQVCGTVLREGTKFCPGCGAQVSDQKAAQTAQQSGMQPQSRVQNSRQTQPNIPYQPGRQYAGQQNMAQPPQGIPYQPQPGRQYAGQQNMPQGRQNMPQPKPRRFPWKRTIAALLAVLIAFHVIHDRSDPPEPVNGNEGYSIAGNYSGQTGGSSTGKTGGNSSGKPGGNSSGSSGANSSGTSDEGEDIDTFDYEQWHHPVLEKTWSSTQVASGTLTKENRTLSGGGASMTINKGFLTEDTKAEIRKVPGTIAYEAYGITIPLTMYEFNAEGIEDDTFLTLEIPVEKPAGGSVGAGWYDEETRTVQPCSFDYDEAAGVVRINATHLSTFFGYPVRNENTRNAMIAHLSDKELQTMLQPTDYHMSLRKYTYCMVHSVEADDNWEIGLKNTDELGLTNMALGVTVTEADLIGQAESAMITFDGVSEKYLANTFGNFDERILTKNGLAGHLNVPEWMKVNHTGAVEKDLTDRLKSVYPRESIRKIGICMNAMNCLYSISNIINIARKGDTNTAVWETARFGIDRTLDYLGTHVGIPGAAGYAVGVGLFAYALNEFYAEALKGRKDVYIKAYRKYYTTQETGTGYRDTEDWVKVFQNLLKDCYDTTVASNLIQEEVDRYTWEFWTKYGSVEWLQSVMTDDEKSAWGVAGEAGLKPEYKTQISNSYKRDLVPVIQEALALLNERNEKAALESYKKEYKQLCEEMNRIITVRASDGSVKNLQPSAYGGCTVRFSGIRENPLVTDKKQWEFTLDKYGKGSIKMTLLAHLTANAGDVLEVLSLTEKDSNNQPVILETRHFDMSSPNPDNPLCVFKGKGPVEQGKLEGDWWEEGEPAGKKVLRLEYNQKGTLTFRINTDDEAPDPYEAKDYNVEKDGTISMTLINPVLARPWDPGPTERATITFKDKDHISVWFDGTERSFVREPPEAAELKAFLGVWEGVYKGHEVVLTLAFRDGHVMEREENDDVSPYATITDSYTLNGKKDVLVLKSAYLKGGTVTYTLTDPKHLTTVNGDGEKTEFKLVRSVNFVQINASKDGSKPKPGSVAVPPTGRITLGN